MNQRVRASKFTISTPKEVLNSAATFFLGKGKWNIAYQTEDTLVLRHRPGPSIPLGCLLLFFMILPGVLYLLLAKGGESSLTIWVSPEGSATSVKIDWSGQEWRDIAHKFLDTLPEASPDS